MEIETDFPQRLRKNKVVYIGENHEPLTIHSVRTQDRALLVTFLGLESIDDVANLRNKVVCVKTSEVPTLPEGEYYYHQLLDLKVISEDGRPLGILTEILETGANDVYVVTAPDGKELLFPVIDGVILDVDLEKGAIRVRPPEWG